MLPTPPASPTATAGFDWSAVPDWLAAIGTLAAVAVSIYLAQRDGRRLKVEREEAAEDRAEFRRVQAQQAEQHARRLASQVTLVSERGFDPDGTVFRSYQVHNGGDEPIAVATIVERPIVGDTLSPTREVIKTWPIIEAGGQRTVQGPRYSRDEAPLVRQMDRSLIFRDGLGQLWLRNELGALRALGDDDPDRPGIVLLPA